MFFDLLPGGQQSFDRWFDEVVKHESPIHQLQTDMVSRSNRKWRI